MRIAVSPRLRRKTSAHSYVLEEQIGFILRCASQRHTTIFAELIGDNLTPTQWTTMIKLREVGSCAQNFLASVTAIDVATIKGVIDRLSARGLIKAEADPTDGRRLIISLTERGNRVIERSLPKAVAITEKTLEPLSLNEQEILLRLLSKIM